MGGGVKKTQGGHRSELLQPIHDHHPAVVDIHFDTTDPSVEAIRNEGGVKIGERNHCCKVLQGRQVNSFV